MNAIQGFEWLVSNPDSVFKAETVEIFNEICLMLDLVDIEYGSNKDYRKIIIYPF